MRLTGIERAFKELKHDLAIRPILHRRQERIEAHIIVSFIACCLLVTLLRRFAIGLIKTRGLAVAESMRNLAGNPRRLLDFLILALQGGDEDDEQERRPLPDVGQDQRQPR